MSNFKGSNWYFYYFVGHLLHSKQSLSESKKPKQKDVCLGFFNFSIILCFSVKEFIHFFYALNTIILSSCENCSILCWVKRFIHFLSALNMIIDSPLIRKIVQFFAGLNKILVPKYSGMFLCTQNFPFSFWSLTFNLCSY